MLNFIDLKRNVNVLQEYLYVYMVLKAWKSYAEKFLEAAQSAESYLYSEHQVQSEFSSLDEFEEQFEEEENSQIPMERKHAVSLDSKDKLEADVAYAEVPKVQLKISYLDRIFQKKAKDNIKF